MGNEGSQLSGLEIEEKPLEITDFWAQYQATIKDSCRYFGVNGDGSVSVLKGEVVLGPLWTVSTPLEKYSNNLLKYRHPCIIRYISTWRQRSTMFLVTEFVQPLSLVLSSQTPLQICIGLNNILRALVFLHEQAGMSHNNVSTSAIYVTADGQWKLGGLQYLCPFSELTPAYLKHARIHRYDKAVDPNEDEATNNSQVDQYAFSVLVEDVFKGCNDDDVPHLAEFKKFCRNSMQHHEPMKRPGLSEVLQHNFFNHEFITIYKFLNFITLKSEEEKNHFFGSILESLKCYDEETVAKQLSGLLLSRVTLLDETARKDVIPYIFKPKNERLQNPACNGFFTLGVFKEHVKPRLMQLFGVRDSQIRMILLAHFSKYVQVFSHEELSQHVLPELLLGIKDTDDSLVATTLVCLSELVPILGADAVVGGKRAKLFTDGRPNSKVNYVIPNPSRKNINANVFSPPKSLHELSCSEQVYEKENFEFDKTIALKERPSPVGGEAEDDDVKAVIESENNLMHSEDDWSDWDSKTHKLTIVKTSDNEEGNNNGISTLSSNSKVNQESYVSKTSILQNAAIEAKKKMVDISDLDIKNQKYDNARICDDEIDFFADMKPVIEKPQVVDIASKMSEEISSKLNFVPDDGEDHAGWDDNWNE